MASAKLIQIFCKNRLLKAVYFFIPIEKAAVFRIIALICVLNLLNSDASIYSKLSPIYYYPAEHDGHERLSGSQP